MKPMLLTATTDLPEGEDWIYEIKYDGFRAVLEVTEEGIKLWSRNGKDLGDRFPEISEIDIPKKLIPFSLDGELTILNTSYQSNFQALQTRGRMRKQTRIEEAAKTRPATFIAFDAIHKPSLPLTKRKKETTKIVTTIGHPHIQEAQTFKRLQDIQTPAELHLAEGIVAKREKSTYQQGERGQQWLKWKQWRTVSGFLQNYDLKNGYYEVGIHTKEGIQSLGKFKHGLSDEENETLRTFFKEHGEKEKQTWVLQPSVCVDIHCLNAEEEEFREPMFHQFRFDLSAEECTEEKLKWDLSLFPSTFEPSHINKHLWSHVTKRDFLCYMREIAPHMLPFINEKKLTLIRYPDGINEESFFQKHRPDHAPDYLKSWMENGEPFMICDQLLSLLWVANQGALEYHIPFEKAGGQEPDEIVIDLDPPERRYFHYAITAAHLLKHLLDELEVRSFIKTSGNKGMQIHIPIQEGDLSYEETRKITETLATLLIQEEPDLFTVERLKKKRGDRLYIDYVQHAEGKTIIAPYSPRATEEATVATPLYWEEVVDGLKPELFTINTIPSRIAEKGCPFKDYNLARKSQPINKLKKLLQ